MFAGSYFTKSYFTGFYFPPNGTVVIEDTADFWRPMFRPRRR
jgi:hypothetical protein